MSKNKPTTLTSLAEQNYRPLVFILSGLLLFGSGMFLAKAWQVRNPPPIKYEVAEPSGEITGISESEPGFSKDEEILIKVDVSGAVNSPGVCELSEGARIEDAIGQSGGFSDEADREWVSKNLNLAAKLFDGDKLYIPKKGEVVGATVVGGGALSAGSQKPAVGGLININTASQSELESLDGIGPSIAQKIIAYRSGNPFDNIEEIMEVKGIATGKFEGIKDRITVR